MPTINIPGIIQDKLSKMTKQDLKEEKEYEAKQIIKNNTQASINQSAMLTNGLTPNTWTGINPWDDLNTMWGQQKIPPFQYEEYKKPFGPIDGRQQSEIQEQLLREVLQGRKKTKSSSPFEEILDQLFSTTEKEQFLIDTGYTLSWDNQDGSYDISRVLSDGTVKRITNSLDDLFLKEISVKFKNLLLTKQTLKIKI